MVKSTITLTFRDCVDDNFGGKSRIGEMKDQGKTFSELQSLAKNYAGVELIDLNKNLPEGTDADKAGEEKRFWKL